MTGRTTSSETLLNQRNPIETNATIASKLREAAVLLEAQEASPSRSVAYFKAANTIEMTAR